MNNALEVKGLKKKYGRHTVIDALDMNVPKGSIYGLIGRNGAGKTTLMRIICGLQQADEGEYTLFGTESSDRRMASVRKRMGAVIETPAIYMELTARENLEAQYIMLGMPDFSGIDELLKMVGLDDAGRKKAGKFSLGMKQRLGIAVALAGNPDILLLDEPINGLDPQGIVDMRELIFRLNREKQITIIIASHILDELARVSTHYGFLGNGRILKEMSAEEIEKEYRRCIGLKVSDIRALSVVMEEHGVDYRVISDDEAEIYSDSDVTDIVLMLHERGCRVISCEKRNETLESFYINLTGGEEHV